MSEERGYSGSAIALGFILGGALGASLAMLFAPESGRRTRERLRDLAADARDKTIDISDELRDKAEDVLERGREVFEEKKSILSAAVQAGKEAIQRERERSLVALADHEDDRAGEAGQLPTDRAAGRRGARPGRGARPHPPRGGVRQRHSRLQGGPTLLHLSPRRRARAWGRDRGRRAE